jgi:hypothetical protein
MALEVNKSSCSTEVDFAQAWGLSPSMEGSYANKLRQRFRKLNVVKGCRKLLASCGTFFVLIAVNYLFTF